MLGGHAWTIRRHLEGRFSNAALPASRLYRLRVPDARFGDVELRGRFTEVDGAEEVAVVVHGLGGSSQSPYVLDCARFAHASGISCLRLDLRGSDRLGQDLFHAGLGSDLHRVLESPEVARYQRRYLVGYFLGGHVCLRYAADTAAPTASAVAVVGAPLELEAAAAMFDGAPSWPYRSYVLESLLAIYAAFVRKRGAWPVPLDAARRLTRIRDFDQAIIAPRFGFEDAGAYYFGVSVAHVASRIRLPTFLLHASDDPMVPAESVEPWLEALPKAVSVFEATRGGHVAFPADLSLGQFAPRGLLPQLFAWLRRNGTDA